MAIPEAQLETWSHVGSVTQSSSTYNAIKAVLEAAGTPYSGRDVEVFLQGSYGNDTNIWAESDVDIVIRLGDCWRSDLSDLTVDDKAAYKRSVVPATYGHVQFKHDVLEVLQDAYGSDAVPGKKAVTIAARGGRRKADIIIAIQYRRYQAFKSHSNQSYSEGICFWNTAGDEIVNYPKQHSTNMTAKHQATGSRLKPMVRVVKNLRGYLVGQGKLDARAAPSYFLEGLLYNVPTARFRSRYQDSLASAITWVQEEATKTDLLCANEQFYLLRNDSHTCWPTADAEAFLQAAVKAWNDW